MGKIIYEKDSVIYSTRDETIVIEPYGNDAVRVRSTRLGKVSDEKWTLLEKETGEFEISGDENRAVIKSGRISAEISNVWGGYSLVFKKDGKEILRTRSEGDNVRKYEHISGDYYKVRAIFDANENERIYGLGQEQQPHFDRKGSSYDICHYNTKSTLPMIYSSLGYGFLWNNPSPGVCEFSNNRTLWEAECAKGADYLVFGGERPLDTMKIYARLTGFPPEMPSWAAGFWQCKLRYESQDELLEVAREYKKRGVPIDAIVIDYFHWTEQGNWEFDPKYWPEPEKMCEELKQLDIRPVVSIWPTINPKSKNYRAMDEENMLVRTENGQYGIFDFYGQQTFIDPTNPKTREYVWEQVKKTYYSYGIKTFWLDEAEPEVHPQQFGNLRFYLGNGAETALLYPYYYAKLFYEGLRSEGENEVALLTRAAYPGSQKFGAIVWNGDIPSTFEALYESIISGLSMSVCGIVWWNSDIGGFHQGDIESDYFRELIVRWFQFGLFCPVMRLHGARKRTKNQTDRHPGIIEKSGGDNEIWSFGEKNYPILKNLILLRERLKPYILKQMKTASETGAPVMRPMFFDFYEDEECYKLSDQYMFGPDIIFAPIYRRGETKRRVYLPEGQWRRAGEDEAVKGAGYIECEADIEHFIAFVREGSEVEIYFRY